jgi:hypothetical protein
MNSVDDIVKIKDLLKIPGVNAVAVGNKIKAGKKQDEVAIRVYVNKKRKKDEIPENELIPERIRGVSVDVMEGGKPTIAHGAAGMLPDDSVYSTLVTSLERYFLTLVLNP